MRASGGGPGVAVGMLVIGLLAGFGGGFLVGQHLTPPPPPRVIDVPRPALPVAGSGATLEPPQPAPTPQAPVLPAPLDPARGAPSDSPGAQNVTDAPVIGAPTAVTEPAVQRPTPPVARTLSGPREEPGTARPTATVDTPGTLRFDSRPPGATVYVDDVRVGATPTTIDNISPGTHRVRVELPGHSPWVTVVKVEPGAQLFVGASLE